MKIELDTIWLAEITLKVLKDELEEFNKEQVNPDLEAAITKIEMALDGVE